MLLLPSRSWVLAFTPLNRCLQGILVYEFKFIECLASGQWFGAASAVRVDAADPDDLFVLDDQGLSSCPCTSLIESRMRLLNTESS